MMVQSKVNDTINIFVKFGFKSRDDNEVVGPIIVVVRRKSSLFIYNYM